MSEPGYPWLEEPEEPTACPECGSTDFYHYMPGMTHQGWKCKPHGHLFWTHNGVPKPSGQIIEELRAEIKRLSPEN